MSHGICNTDVACRARAQEKLRSLREKLGERACHLVQINSREESTQDASYERLFRAQQQSVIPGGGAGEPDSRPQTPPTVILCPTRRLLLRFWPALSI